jgi:ADP-L-glycero-D-manno-heptose 6-epimerase
MIVVTGAAGFIGSCLVSFLNREGFNDLVLVDDFSVEAKSHNLLGKSFTEKVERTSFFNWFEKNHHRIQFVYHLGARTDTTEKNIDIFEKLNLSYSKQVWEYCCRYGIALVYASSAAVYGSGDKGYSDDHSLMNQYVPLNPYGASKYDFDAWVLLQTQQPYHWAGLRFFNVYGPNEYHKGRMASVVFHAYKQLQEKGKITLFRSHKFGISDGEQKRDFVYVMDVCKVMYFLLHHRNSREIYNLGTGNAETFYDLAKWVSEAAGMSPQITFVDTPEDIRNTYQYYTCADISKLRSSGYKEPFIGLHDGVFHYVKNHLTIQSYS